MRGSDPDAAVYYLAAMLEARRGRALHRAADDRARLRGHRQRRPARAARRGRGGAGRRARRPARGAPEPLPGRDLPRPRAEVERELRRDQPRDARTCRSAAPSRRRRRCATARGTAAGSATAQGYVYPHDDPAGFETSYLPEELEGRATTSRRERRGERGRERVVGVAAEDGEDHELERRGRSAAPPRP